MFHQLCFFNNVSALIQNIRGGNDYSLFSSFQNSSTPSHDPIYTSFHPSSTSYPEPRVLRIYLYQFQFRTNILYHPPFSTNSCIACLRCGSAIPPRWFSWSWFSCLQEARKELKQCGWRRKQFLKELKLCFSFIFWYSKNTLIRIYT